MKVKKMINLALLLSMALALSLIESTIPIPFAVPGFRLGFSNIVILICIYFFDFKSSILLSILKSVLLMLVTGSVTSFLYSVVGSFLSATFMCIFMKFEDKYISLIGVSEIGSFFHNLGQVIVASIILSTIKIFYYLPVLILMGIITGLFVGITSHFIIRHLKILHYEGKINGK